MTGSLTSDAMAARDLEAIVELALAEDVGAGDWTTLWTVPDDRRVEARLLAKERGVIAGTAAADPVLAAVLIAVAAAASNFPLGAAWGACIDIGGEHAGVVSACMNTSGQIGALFSPVILAYAVQHFANWRAPLYLTGALYMIGALAWIAVDPEKPIWSANESQTRMAVAEGDLRS